MRHHRAKYDLLAYAEALVDGGAVSVITARHVAACSVCRAEVENIRASLAATGSLPAIEAPQDLTARILQAAAVERKNARRSRRHAIPLRFVHAAGYIAALLLTASWSFTAALKPAHPGPASAVWTAADRQTTAEDIRQAANAVTALAQAVRVPEARHAGPREHESRLDVAARAVDLQKGLAAFERNPECPRVDQVIRSNLSRQAKALKALYVEQSL
ncbi:MAG TPA: hypothetical protein PLO62_14265 [Candidatus Hydrogenedentes bacterium]|nr:hypothetical protein [Candidatus Hydrogenedentota bacterium]HOS02650.1 hypothetical protein [Candidatus Hydrogenedentota bacterium]